MQDAVALWWRRKLGIPGYEDAKMFILRHAHITVSLIAQDDLHATVSVSNPPAKAVLLRIGFQAHGS